MYLFDHHKSLKAYADPRDIIDEFYEVRLDLYESRLEKEISILKADVVKLRNQIRFIGDVVSKNIELNLLSDESVENELKSRGFERLGSPDASQPAESDSNSSFNYLLRMPLLSLTLSNSNRLSEQLHKASEKLAILQGTDIKQLWLNDLEALEKKLKSISASP
jgi:DNA topoisomerase-2